MNPIYIRSLIEDFGRPTMRDAMSRHLAGMDARDIGAEIGVEQDRVEELIAAEHYLASMYAESRRYVDAVIDRD